MAGSTCALPGCSKPPFPSREHAEPRLACGNLHHQLLMAGRFHPSLPHPYQKILDRNADGHCALSSCCDPPSPGHSWCSKPHYLIWLSAFTSSLHLDQICKLPGCTRHVFVDANSSPLQFCGWRHCQKFVMRFALQSQHQQMLPPQVQELHLPQQENLCSPSSSVESPCDHVPSIQLLVQTLRNYASHKSSPENVKVDEDFFNKHPWEACTAEGHTDLFLVPCKYTSKGKRVMITREGYHWKQQGRQVSKNSDYAIKYFTYLKQKGKRNGGLEHRDKYKYNMAEYTTEDVREFALVKLRKNSTVTRRKKLIGQSAEGGKQCISEINDGCSENSGGLNGSDEMAADSCFSDLSPLHDEL